MTTATPWDALLRAPRRPAPTAVEPQGTKVATILRAIEEHQPVTTAELQRMCGLRSKQVWGLMCQPLRVGQVKHDGTYWRMVPDYVPQMLLRAADLLRAAGWTVEEPRT